jgi:hypothetical protein
MGRAQFEQSPVAPQLRFRIRAEDSSSPAPIRIKVRDQHSRDHRLRSAADDSSCFMHYDLGYIDLEQRTLPPLDNPFGTRLSPMS